MKQKIDFMGIGAQKSATTWLSENLKKHPEIWMPPIKELHYFDRLSFYKSDNNFSKTSSLKHYLKNRTKYTNRKFQLKKLIETAANDPSDLLWLYRYFFSEPDDNWYMDLFKKGKNKIKGEITPSYSLLNDNEVKHVKNLLPELKIIFLMRNPIYRCWSQIRFYWTKNPTFNINNTEMVKNFINSPQQILRSNYIGTINTWSKYFSKEQFFIGYYDDVNDNPEKLLVDILNFLAADRTYFSQYNNIKINSSKEYIIPSEIRLYLAEKYHSQLEELAKMLGGHAETWLDEAEKIIQSK
ncbi:MAG: sulfotransferase [Thermodesulfobacteriota bacterium]